MLGGDVVTFVDMGEFLVSYSEYEQRTCVSQTKMEETGYSRGGVSWWIRRPKFWRVI